MSSFEFDEGALNAFLGVAMGRLITAYQDVLDGLVERYRAHPVEEIKPALAAAWARSMTGTSPSPNSASGPRQSATACASSSSRAVSAAYMLLQETQHVGRTAD
ncbi:MAG: hypothetical protein M3Y42_00595 [Actinomycetota bacterium]|nr:hypothetical protein [Actinomycetota bacterium]MDQ2955450.1 hypothetical protein [Actinomycetota bacterium]